MGIHRSHLTYSSTKWLSKALTHSHLVSGSTQTTLQLCGGKNIILGLSRNKHYVSDIKNKTRTTDTTATTKSAYITILQETIIHPGFLKKLKSQIPEQGISTMSTTTAQQVHHTLTTTILGRSPTVHTESKAGCRRPC